ncbi:MAG: inositol monophosphatase [Bacteroidia bacterium]|nr:inositol monophosphatase [Bacteroidia bacterium]MCX7652839.1 inositol monophosphatase [Bacteroidia bacterium]MDW8415947.1 inositol monophosphatase family protein [Bacteroidia bacterium]
MVDTVVSLPALFHAIREVGAYLHREFKQFSRSRTEYKTARDPVSYADRQAEAILQAHCARLLPEAGFILEESGGSDHEKDLLWVIDPLDGTKNFVHGIPLFGISVALLHHRRPILGVVYAVPQDEIFWAIRGGGAYCGEERLYVSETDDPDKLLVVTGFMYREPERAERYFHALNEIMRRFGGLRRLGSAALDLAYVAAGRLDVFFEMDLNPWDVAAGALLVAEAGGVVTDFSGGENFLFGGRILAGGKWAHQAVQTVLEQSGLS